MKLIRKREDLLEVLPKGQMRPGQLLGIFENGDDFTVETSLTDRELLELLNDFTNQLYKDINFG